MVIEVSVSGGEFERGDQGALHPPCFYNGTPRCHLSRACNKSLHFIPDHAGLIQASHGSTFELVLTDDVGAVRAVQLAPSVLNFGLSAELLRFDFVSTHVFV